jgi:hypothetical protein
MDAPILDTYAERIVELFKNEQEDQNVFKDNTDFVLLPRGLKPGNPTILEILYRALARYTAQ